MNRNNFIIFYITGVLLSQFYGKNIESQSNCYPIYGDIIQFKSFDMRRPNFEI